MLRLIHQRLDGDLSVDAVSQTRHIAGDDVMASGSDDLRFDIHRFFVVREPSTGQNPLPHILRTGSKRRMVVEGQQIGDEIVLALVEQAAA